LSTKEYVFLVVKVVVVPRSEIPETARHKEIQNICTMVMEMFLPAKMRLLSSDMSQKERFITAKRVYSAGKFAVPGLVYSLRNRKHFPCFYRVIETRVLVWENEK
jgi:hypothetical protein